MELGDRLDWVAKKQMLQRVHRQRKRRAGTMTCCTRLDLEYHNINPRTGLYYGLEEMGAMQPHLHRRTIAARHQHAAAKHARQRPRGSDRAADRAQVESLSH